ncbi:hypothetical protein ETAA8_36110 [Anatilimnocola aggregata]|uniref:DNA primase/polymerase bifunctional N-terminal domain-containing protein n=1 Tax=Anatilimnocola aggregata TaxID=2528021 RepID=A0A517YE49_9BACT|nr:bifunctional DNA primase/polymerase [Anatilimnocola aggregata]QDU28509.1 hypothetical protein ETAA8_36110 [Anatilimnocola aggregata]
MADLLAVAEQYRDWALCAIPADRNRKMPIGSWKPFQTTMPAKGFWKRVADAVCVVTGKVSGNLEVIDFDFKAELFPAWMRLLHQAKQELFDRLVIEQSQSGGRHVFYRCPGAVIEGNQDLAQRRFTRESGDAFTYQGKTLTPVKRRGQWIADATLIETRGEGGIILTAPSPGYVLVQGSFESIPLVTPEERDALLGVARALHEIRVEKKPPASSKPANGKRHADRPGDDFNSRCDFLGYLESKGWEFITSDGENKLLRRPGKTGFNWSASLLGKSLYVFSTNAGLPANESFSPFGVYTYLEHDGDFEKAAAELGRQGFGAPAKPARKFDQNEHNPRNDEYTEAQLVPEVDLTGIMGKSDSGSHLQRDDLNTAEIPAGETSTVTIVAPPRPERRQSTIDDESYSIPGFIDSLIDYTLDTAPYPSRPLAWAGAVALLSTLIARKIKGPTGLLTNVMTLGLASSGSGKDHPRRISQRILHHVGMEDRLQGRIASGQGLEDLLFAQPAQLCQIDEFDSTLVSINKPGDPIGAELGARLMDLYSASQGSYCGRVKVRQGEARAIVRHPHVSLFATCVPGNFFANLTPKLLSNGLIARMIIVESGERGQGQSVRTRALPQNIVDAAEFWRDFNPGGGNLADVMYAKPLEIDYTAEADNVFEAARRKIDAKWDACHRAQNDAGCSIWARVIEQAHKLSLIYACSEDRRNLQVGEEAAIWATNFAERQAKWLLDRVAEQVGEETKFEVAAKRILDRIRLRGGRTHRSDALKGSRVLAKEFDALLHTLEQRGQVKRELLEGCEWLQLI